MACALSVSAPAAADPVPRITRGPYLQDLAPTSVEIRAELAAAAPASVTFTARGADAGGGPRTIRDARSTTTHVVRVDGLTPSTHYTYSFDVGSTSMTGEVTTGPPPDSKEPFTFLAYGDNRTDDVAHAAVVRQMQQSPSDFLVHTGDFVQNGGVEADWQSFFDVESPLLRSRCVFACVGNHEIIDGAGTNYLRLFGPVSDGHGDGEKPKLYGSFRWGSARFLLLNAMDSFESGPTRAWLEDELARADAEDVTWRIVVLHHSPWSAGPHGGNRRMLGAGIPELLKKHRVDLVLAGHDHIYERGFAAGLPYVITGGGGAPLYPIDHPLPSTRKAESAHHFLEVTVASASIALVAKRDDGSVLDRCGLPRATDEWDCDPKGAPPDVTKNPSAPISFGVGQPSSSKCGCDVVGTCSSRFGGFAGLALLALAFLRKRRLQ